MYRHLRIAFKHGVELERGLQNTLPHVFDVADRVTVMRRGRRVLTAPIGDVDTDTLLRAMTGLDAYREEGAREDGGGGSSA